MKNFNYDIGEMFKKRMRVLSHSSSMWEINKKNVSSETAIDKESILGSCFAMSKESKLFLGTAIAPEKIKYPRD